MVGTFGVVGYVGTVARKKSPASMARRVLDGPVATTLTEMAVCCLAACVDLDRVLVAFVPLAKGINSPCSGSPPRSIGAETTIKSLGWAGLGLVTGCLCAAFCWGLCLFNLDYLIEFPLAGSGFL